MKRPVKDQKWRKTHKKIKVNEIYKENAIFEQFKSNFAVVIYQTKLIRNYFFIVQRTFPPLLRTWIDHIDVNSIHSRRTCQVSTKNVYYVWFLDVESCKSFIYLMKIIRMKIRNGSEILCNVQSIRNEEKDIKLCRIFF